MQKPTSDVNRLKKLLRHYKREKFQKDLDGCCIECDGIVIQNTVQKISGIHRVKYLVWIDGRPIVMNDRLSDRVRNMFNDVYYYSPDTTSWRERLGFALAYLAVCGVVVAVTMFAAMANKSDVKENSCIVSDMPQSHTSGAALNALRANRSR